MNYAELQIANDLVKKNREIDFHLKMTERSPSDIRISVNSHVIFFDNKYKPKVDNALKRIKNELVEELNKLGVVEDKWWILEK